MSLRQVANATKISIKTLEAVERNDLAHLPGGIFTRAFVRSYATEVGLDPDESVSEFNDQFPYDTVSAGQSASLQAEDPQEVESERRIASTVLRLILISLPIAALIVYFGNAGRPSRPAVAESSGPGSSADQPPVETPARVLVPSDDLRSATSQGAAATIASEPLTVTVAMARPCRVSIVVDGDAALQQTLDAGELRTFDFRRELVLTTADAGAVSLTINGAVARPLGEPGAVVTARITLMNYRDYLVPQ